MFIRRRVCGADLSRWCAVAVTLLAPWLLPAPTARAYPIPPQTLWDLGRGSDSVVVARVDSVEKLDVSPEKEDRLWNTASALLLVEATLVGPVAKGVRVAFDPNVICPAPARYLPGRTVLAFLDHGNEGTMVTVGRSYGTRYPAPEQLPVLSRVIALAHAAPDTRDGQAAWVLAAAVDPETRWDALSLVAPRADVRLGYYARPPTLVLDDAERRALAAAFVARPSWDHTVVMLLAAVGDLPDAELDRAVVGVIDGLIAAGSVPWWADAAAALLRVRLGLADGSITSDDLEDPLVRMPTDPVQVLARWRALRGQIALPIAPLTPPPREAPLPVGAYTPP